MTLKFRFKSGVQKSRNDDDLLLVDQIGRQLRLRAPSAAIHSMLERLAGEGSTMLDLMDASFNFAPLITMQNLEERGWISLDLVEGEKTFITLEPQANRLERRHQLVRHLPVQWSRFVQITPQVDGVLMQVPLQGRRLHLHHESLMPLIWELRSATCWDEVLQSLPRSLQKEADDLLMLLLSAGVLGFVENDGMLSCDRKADRQLWSREDLTFHYRSRLGWHERSVGATYRGASLGSAPGLRHQGRFLKAFPLPKPTLHEPEPGFFTVVEKRRSRRLPGTNTVTIQQLSNLLWSSLRIQEFESAISDEVLSYESASRPVACGGAMHEVDTYLLIRSCDGIASGLYRYEPSDHQLLRLDGLNDACKLLLEHSCRSAGTQQQPDILFQFAGRYGRLSWKYEGLTYSMMLKNLGAIIQQLYLVSTALNLAPCSLGRGDSELFSRATSLDPLEDTCIGEFMLSSITPSIEG